MTTTFKIANMERYPENEVVFNVTYVMNFAEAGETDRRVGSIVITGDPTSPDFIPFADLTEAIVIEWVKEDLGADAITEIEAAMLIRLQERAEAKAHPTEIAGVPW